MKNRDQLLGAWDQLKGRAKRIYGELTDDEAKKAEGSVDKLFGKLQERFGDAKEAIKKKIDSVHLK